MAFSHRLLSLPTALLLAASSFVALGGASASADETLRADPTTDSARAPAQVASGDPFADAGDRPDRSALALPSSESSVAPLAKRSPWPIRSRTGSLTTHSVAPQGDPSQQFVSVKVLQDRLKGTMTAAVVLAGTPTEATDSRLRVGFGKVVKTQQEKFCQSTAGSVAGDIHSYGTSGAYDGARITYRQKLAGAKKQAWNCAFAQMISADQSVLYDAVVTGSLKEQRQKPILTIKVPNRDLNRSGFTRVPIKIMNSKQTIATAPKVKLSWKTSGAQVRATKRVGTIKPGRGKKSTFLVRSTRGDRTGSIKFTVKSKNYKSSVTLRIRPA